MNKKFLLVFIVLVAIGSLFVFLREDKGSWICEKGEWIAYGNPSESKPKGACYDPSGFSVFFGNSGLGSGDDCALVFPLWRETETSDNPFVSAMLSLLEGPTDEEEARGYFSGISEGVGIKSTRIENKTAFVDFDSEMERGMGGSCRVTSIRSQIIETLKQFPDIDQVVISVEGRTEDILQP